MKTKTKHSQTVSQDGKKTGAPAPSTPSSCLKTRCKQLTVGDYIELVCENDLDILTISGTPTREEQNEAMMAIVSEFATLSGGSESGAMAVYNRIVVARAKIFAISTVINVLTSVWDKEAWSEACKILDECGVSTKTWKPETILTDIKGAERELKALSVRMKIDIEKYNNLAARNEGQKLTEEGIRGEMVAISTGAGLAITDDCNLATYAAHRKAHTARVRALEAAKQNIKK